MSEPITQDIPLWRKQVAQLQRVQFGFVSRDKQMVSHMARVSALCERDDTVTLTPNETWWLARLLHKYRMQLGRLESSRDD